MMLSLFAVPKHFSGQSAYIQHNAITSWTRLGTGCDVVLLGDDVGVAEAATRHQVRHKSTIARNEFGTPLLTDVVERMYAQARYPIVALVNADIILLSDFLLAVEAIAQSRKKFMIVSSCFNCAIERPLAFETGWDIALRTRVRTENRMYPGGGSDLFVFPQGLIRSVLPFAIGRGYWDNWLMREALRAGASLIDATAALTAVHQDHTYDHVSGLTAGGDDDRAVYSSHEGRRNLELIGGLAHVYTVLDASEILTAHEQLISTWRPHLIDRRIKATFRRLVGSLLLRSKVRRAQHYLPVM